MASSVGIILFVVHFGSSCYIVISHEKYEELVSHDILLCVVTGLVHPMLSFLVFCLLIFF